MTIRTFCYAKIHNATVTESNSQYDGSITIDSDLMIRCNLAPFEQVHVLNITNGERIITYAIEGESGSGQICLNGAAARLFQAGDKVIILAYISTDIEQISPIILIMNDDNSVKKFLCSDKNKHYEDEIKLNSILLDSIDFSDHNGKFVVFNEGNCFFSETYEEGVKIGKEMFGKDVGFIVRKIGSLEYRRC